jgi:hypothetical protein
LPNGYDATAAYHVAYVDFGSFHSVVFVFGKPFKIKIKVRTSALKVIYRITIGFNEMPKRAKY